MELARTLLKLWQLRRLVALGLVVAIGAGAVTLALTPKHVYSAASTQLIVDAPHSALGNSEEDLTPYTQRAVVLSQLMTTSTVLQYIGEASGIPGNLIAASGPESLGGPVASHVPTAKKGNKVISGSTSYKLNLLQNPDLPTIDIYTEAPTTRQAIALANGAVTGLANYLKTLDTQKNVKPGNAVTIRSGGAATGGVVDPGADKSIAVIVFAIVFIAWCVLLLFFLNLREQLRTARRMTPQRPNHLAVEHLQAPRIPRHSSASPTNAIHGGDQETADGSLASTGPSNAAGGSGEVVRRAWLRKSS